MFEDDARDSNDEPFIFLSKLMFLGAVALFIYVCARLGRENKQKGEPYDGPMGWFI
jgi:hypothetical protein